MDFQIFKNRTKNFGPIGSPCFDVYWIQTNKHNDLFNEKLIKLGFANFIKKSSWISKFQKSNKKFGPDR